jgi:hypothetical protein
MFRIMDWQETAALGVVAATVGVFAWHYLRPRRVGWRRSGQGHCGCGSSSAVGMPNVLYQARKGEPARISVIVRQPAPTQRRRKLAEPGELP